MAATQVKDYQQSNINNQKSDVASFIVLVLGLAIAFLIWKAGQTGVPKEPPKVTDSKIEGTPAPDFTLPDLNGVNHTLSRFKGKVVFLNIWATWCKPCKDEMPSMEKLHQRFKDRDFIMLAVSIDKDGKNAVEPFMKEYNLTFPALLDPDGITSKLYKTTGVPETFIIDKNGNVILKTIGPRDWGKEIIFEVFEKIISKA
ncbi:MAG: TlpA family protein disulfide reductase [Nitrospinae bacterium]|nr:TlpA family protein disulfide reductase [Nitrospinota bacterium]